MDGGPGRQICLKALQLPGCTSRATPRCSSRSAACSQNREQMKPRDVVEGNTVDKATLAACTTLTTEQAQTRCQKSTYVNVNVNVNNLLAISI